jgi:hypothetical protein
MRDEPRPTKGAAGAPLAAHLKWSALLVLGAVAVAIVATRAIRWLGWGE